MGIAPGGRLAGWHSDGVTTTNFVWRNGSIQPVEIPIGTQPHIVGIGTGRWIIATYVDPDRLLGVEHPMRGVLLRY